MAQIKLQQIGDATWLVPGMVNIGIYVRDGKAFLIDSGNDKEAGRQLGKLIAEQGWELTVIINTHSNADHIGGNNFLQRKTDCRIAATGGEALFIRKPEMEGAFLYGGYPYPGLDNKFLRAAPSEVTDIVPSRGPILINGMDTGLEAVPLPGHFIEMIGIRTPDSIFFVADSVFSERIMDKYHLFYLYDIGSALETLDFLETAESELFVPSHADPVREIGPLVQINKNKITEISNRIAEICKTPAGIEEIMASLCDMYSLTIDKNQYLLVGSTVRSYCSYLAAEGSLVPEWSNSGMRWCSA